MHHVAKTVSVLTSQNLDVNGCLQHVAGLAETLRASTAKLKDEACKALLLVKISESFSRDCPREDNPPILPVDSHQRVAVPQVPLSNQATDTVAVSATSTKLHKVTAIAVAQSQVADAQRTVELLILTAAKKKFDDEDKKACYFEAHAHALELAIDREDTGLDLNAALDYANGDLPNLEYEYRSAGEEANREEKAAETAPNKLQKLTRLLAKITPNETPEIEVADKCVIPQPSELPAATAEKIRERVRSTIQRIFSSYIRSITRLTMCANQGSTGGGITWGCIT
ncbi:unnamed protein product [Peronospora effusa]|nr:unnamed protein product [Peronospora effusa]